METDNNVIQRRGALVEQPLKTSPATGASLAGMGLAQCIPLLHGSQGCCAFTKVYLIQHFREPMPLQNTAIDHISAVMGGDDSLSSALALLCEKHSPELILVISSGLTEMQGCDLQRVVQEFKQNNPQFNATQVVSVNCPDFVGSMQTGFADTLMACFKQLLAGPYALPILPKAAQKTQVTILPSVAHSPADIELIKDYCEAFDIDALVLPDISDSLDGHLADEDYSVTSTGGASLSAIQGSPSSDACLVLGHSMQSCADYLSLHHGVPSYQFGMGLGETDKLIQCLAKLSGKPVPAKFTRQRKRLQDAMLDSHFLLSSAKVAAALEPDLAASYNALLCEIGAKQHLLVTTINTPELKTLSAEQVIVGDLSDLREQLQHVELVIGNTHCANLCEPSVPVLRAGYPCHDRFGNSDILQLGYEGARQRLFAMANLLKAYHSDEVPCHISAYRFEPEQLTPISETSHEEH